MRKLWRMLIVGAALTCVGSLGVSGSAIAGTDASAPPDTTAPPVDAAPLVPVPQGCDGPITPQVVFVGTVVDKDYRTVRYSIDQVRAGDAGDFVTDGQIDIRYGIDAQYLDESEQYLVGAMIDPVLGLMTSRVTDPIEDFGGDEVIGLAESDVDCPVWEDPHRTLTLDGGAIDGGLLDPLGGSTRALIGAILTPLAVVFAAVFGLAVLRNGGKFAVRAAAGSPLRD